MAVIIGVFHMTKGIVIKGINCVFFGDYQVFFFEVITGLIILLGLFGWMDVLIFAKWFNEYIAYNFMMPAGAARDEAANKVGQSPSIYNLMINNFLKVGKNTGLNVEGETVDLYLFNGQRAISETFVVLVIVCVPIFLCVKPCILLCCGPKDEHHAPVTHSEVGASEAEAAAEEGLIQRNSVQSSMAGGAGNAYKDDLA